MFLGPTHDGISPETGLLKQWPPNGPPLLWEREVGTGYSAPSVRGNRLVLHHRIGREEIVECLRADNGDSLWEFRYPSRFVDPYGYNNGPRCSPLLTQTHCYTLGAEGKLCCLTLDDGGEVWSRNVKDEFNTPDGFFGVGATPVLEDGRLIVLAGGQPNSGVVAFDAATGETLWEAVGKETWDGAETGWPRPKQYEWTGEEMVVSYSSPVVATVHGRKILFCLMRQGLVALDPETGDELDHYWFRSRTYESVNAARPVVIGDTVFLSAAYQAGAALLRVAPETFQFEEVWRDPRGMGTHWSTAIFHDGHYFGFSGRHENEAELQCVEAKTGEQIWATSGWNRPLTDLRQTASGEIVDTQSGEVVPWPFYGRGAAILAEGKFIVLGERGTLALVEANAEKFVEISRCKAPRMHYPSWTAPVLSRGRLFLRCEDALVCLDLLDSGGDNPL
ncbi:MAG: PQQ-binding-like beta-propeller repeat protein [Maioricimonas sp. JB049]